MTGVGAEKSTWRRSADNSRLWLGVFLAIAGLSGVIVVRRVLAACGELSLPLDDSYIHLQYARALSQGTPFVYSLDAVPSPGATSLLWPCLLAPAFWLGLNDSQACIVPIVYGFFFFGLLAYETGQSARRLTGSPLGWLAGALVLGFGANWWFAASGMAVLPFAWVLMRSARRAADWVELPPEDELPPRLRIELLALAWLAPLTRPEGILATGILVAAFVVRDKRAYAPWALACAGGLLGPSCVNWLFTGSAISTTALAKWMPLNPYYSDSIISIIWYYIQTLFLELLNGEAHARLFVPSGARSIATLSLLALAAMAWRRPRFRTLAMLIIAGGMLLPTSYETFLVNRLRYLWPFAPAWFVGATVLAVNGTGQLRNGIAKYWSGAPRAEYISAPALAAMILALAALVPRSISDLAASASAISRQQVAMGRWIAAELPDDSLVGVNDTGAVAYFGRRRTFDLVGLTTTGEARHWTAGAGSRFEHYEHLTAAKLPDYLVIYPEWLNVPALLGRQLHERRVRSTILGGERMVAFVADYGALGSGQHSSKHPGTAIDELDTADLESESAHDFELGPARAELNHVVEHRGHFDGGRSHRSSDRFLIELQPGGAFVMRLGSEIRQTLELRIDDTSWSRVTVPVSPWQEHEVAVPPGTSAGKHRVEIRVLSPDAFFDSLHYFSF